MLQPKSPLSLSRSIQTIGSNSLVAAFVSATTIEGTSIETEACLTAMRK